MNTTTPPTWQPTSTPPPHMNIIQVKVENGDEQHIYKAIYNERTGVFETDSGKAISNVTHWRFFYNFVP